MQEKGGEPKARGDAPPLTCLACPLLVPGRISSHVLRLPGDTVLEALACISGSIKFCGCFGRIGGLPRGLLLSRRFFRMDLVDALDDGLELGPVFVLAAGCCRFETVGFGARLYYQAVVG